MHRTTRPGAMAVALAAALGVLAGPTAAAQPVPPAAPPAATAPVGTPPVAPDDESPPPPWQVVDAGKHTSCGVRTDASLWCWGQGDAFGGDRDELAPVRVDDGAYSSVSVGGWGTCAVAVDGRLWCSWLGLADRSLSTRDDATWSSVAAGRVHTCGVQTDGSLWCWGDNRWGQLGTGRSAEDQPFPVQVGSDTDWSTVSAGGEEGVRRPDSHTCATKADGSLWCWGANHRGQLGMGRDRDEVRTPERVGAAADWSSVAVGSASTCGVRSTEASLWCWGRNSSGELGTGAPKGSSEPTRVDDARWVTVALGDRHACGVREDASAWCWGLNADGRLGTGANASAPVPAQVAGDDDWAVVSAADWSSCGVRTDGTAGCWGSGTEGRLGTGTYEHAPRPADVLPRSQVWLSTWASIDRGCGLTDEGRALCYGNVRGLGDARYARPVVDGSGWTDVVRGAYYVCLLDGEQRLSCVGSGPLGRGEAYAPASLDPQEVEGGGRWVDVSGGQYHVCGVQDDRSLWCWGENRSGQLGTGDVEDRGAPTRVDGSWVDVETYVDHTCAIDVDAAMWCWGRNWESQLGNGSKQWTSPTPGLVAGGITWSSASAGGTHTCGIDTDGAAWCWGENLNGQLGDGTTTERRVPSRVDAAPGWAQLDTGGRCALRDDGSAWCWGSNAYGALGNGTVGGFETSPVPVVGGHELVSLGGGCGVTADGAALCWGAFGGDGTDLEPHPRPTPVRSVKGA